MMARSLLRDRRGVTVVEFALISPVLFGAVMGGYELVYQAYVQSVLRGEISRAGRSNVLERSLSDGGRYAIDESIREAILRVAPHARIDTPTRVSFASYARVLSPAEPDANNNGVCDPGETYEDTNGNGRWDSNSGVTDGGGAKDVIVYTVKLEYDRTFPVGALLGMSNTVQLEAATFLRMQPYDLKTAPVIRTC
jgi:Flp pilus assembly pilin Flp